METSFRNINPYAGVEWKKVRRVTGSTHMHCTNAEQLKSYISQGLEFATLSNYYPSAPYWPLADIRKNSFSCGQQGGVKNGRYTGEWIDFNAEITAYSQELTPEIRAELPFSPGERLFPEVPENLLEAPNAEHHHFSDYSVYLHVTSPGARLTSGQFDRYGRFGLAKHGFIRGFPLPWRKAFEKIFDSLLIPDGGGIIINHPTWSHLPHNFLAELLDFDPRVLGIEIYNHGCDSKYAGLSTTEWDALLSTGRQCFGFCVPDHPASDGIWRGRCILLPEEFTAAGCLRALRQGRFYGAIVGNGLRFDRLEFDGKRLYAACNREVVFQLLSRTGVVSDQNGRELIFELPELEREKHVFLRVTAREGRRMEMLFAQPFMCLPA